MHSIIERFTIVWQVGSGNPVGFTLCVTLQVPNTEFWGENPRSGVHWLCLAVVVAAAELHCTVSSLFGLSSLVVPSGGGGQVCNGFSLAFRKLTGQLSSS